jgi:uncharacterized damage-inducible protein DinB
MKIDETLTLFDYNQWANTRILMAAEKLSLEQFGAAAGLSFGSIRATLAHILGTERTWRLRVQEGISPTKIGTENEYPTLDALRTRWQSESHAWRDYLASLEDPALEKIITYKTTSGIPRQNPLWQILTHVVNHGTQFRSEAGVALTRFGYSPGDIDFILYLRQK